MKRAKNDATLSKISDIYQYYFALPDCFSLKAEDRLRSRKSFEELIKTLG